MAERKQSLMKTAGQGKTFIRYLKFAGYGLVGVLVALFLLGLVKG